MQNKALKAQYLVLGICLALTILGVILLFARGLDSNSFLVVVSPSMCTLSFALSFLVYAFIEFISSEVNNHVNYALLATPQKNHLRNVRISLIIAVVTGMVSLYLFFAQGNEPSSYITTAVWVNVPTTLPVLWYLGHSAYEAIRDKAETKTIATLIGMAVFALAVPLCAGPLAREVSSAFLLLFGLNPLLCAMMPFIGKKSD